MALFVCMCWAGVGLLGEAACTEKGGREGKGRREAGRGLPSFPGRALSHGSFSS